VQDAMSAKSVFSEITDRECMLVGIKSRFQIRGFIHELSTDPFGYILLSQFQVVIILKFIKNR